MSLYAVVVVGVLVLVSLAVLIGALAAARNHAAGGWGPPSRLRRCPRCGGRIRPRPL